MKTFPRGIHLSYHKELTQEKRIEDAPVPRKLTLPLQQHAGAACTSLVGVGDQVEAGQKIADSDAPISAPIHSPVDGKVKSIGPQPHHSGLKLTSIVIEPSDEQAPIKPAKHSRDPEPEEIRKIVREAGIVGLGGAAFPTQVKLSPPEQSPVDTVILNGCECEPYLTVDHRLMVERPDAIIDGLRLLIRAVGAKAGHIGIESNKPEAIAAMSDVAGRAGFPVVVLETKFPQGAEKQLIKAVLDRDVPSGALPSSVGALVQNVGTAIAVAEAVNEGIPLTTRVVTVSGSSIKEPGNLRALIGTPVKDLIDVRGGLVSGAAKVILGGPMMGVALTDLDVPVVKATSGIIALSEEEAGTAQSQPCIKCARCVEACPMGLMPNRLSALAEVGIWDEMEDENLFDCIECGSCSFICPSSRPLVHHIRLGKYISATARSGKKGA